MPSHLNEGLMAENIRTQGNSFDTIGLSTNYPTSDRNAAVVVIIMKWSGSADVATSMPSDAFSGLTIRSNRTASDPNTFSPAPGQGQWFPFSARGMI